MEKETLLSIATRGTSYQATPKEEKPKKKEEEKKPKPQNNETKQEKQPDKKPPKEVKAPDEKNSPKEKDVEGDKDVYTLQEAIDHIGFGWFQIKLSVLTGICWMGDSMEMMMLSILGPVLHCEWFITSWEQAVLTTLVMIGMMVSSSFWGTFSDNYGRKTTLLFASLACGYFGVLTAFSPMYEWLAICRFLVGVSVGALPQALTLYSEYLPTKFRAQCMVCVEMFFALGTALEVLLAKLILPTLGWRYFLAASALPVLIFPLLGFFLPESARYFLASGRYDEAVSLIGKVAKDNKKTLPPGKLNTVDHLSEQRGRLQDLFGPKYKAISIILFTCWFLYGFCYFGVALLVPTLFSNPDGCHGNDISKDDRDKCHVECVAFTEEDYNELVITGFADTPGLFIMMGLMTFLGRKISIALCGFAFAAFVSFSNICVNRLLLTFLLFSARAFITGAYQGIYVYTSEVYPTHIRSLAIGVGSGLSRLGAVLTPYLAQVGTEWSAYLGITGYGMIGLLSACIPLALPIETRGKAMKDSDAGN